MPSKNSKISVFCAALMSSFFGFSQINDLDLTNAVQDMLYVSSEFVSSAAVASVYQSSSSWYSSAQTIGKFKLDVSVHFNILPIPKKQKSFVITNNELLTMEIRDATSAEIPTALGGDTATFFDFYIDEEAYEWQAFEGIKQDIVTYPYLQASLGLWKETDLTLRYAPKVTINTSSYDIFGAAIKHSITQYFRKDLNSSQPLKLAVLASYSVFNLDLFFDEVSIEPVDPETGSEPLTSINAIVIDADSWLFQLIASKKVKNFEFSGSLGYSENKFNYTLGGKEGVFLDVFNDLLSLLDERKREFKGDLGANYYFNKFYISSMFTLGKFPNVNIGLHYLCL